eukprot:symbB.v1.2.024403.t1/scaffold2302.1/size82889/1
MADEGQVSPLQPRSPGSTDEVAGATLNPDAAVFHPRQEERSTTNKMNLEKPEPSLVFGGGGHFLSKYGSQGHSDRATGKSTLRKRQPVATESGQPDRVNVQLNQLIVHAGMPERILQIVDENFDQLNVVNLITALHRLASISLASRKAALRRELRFRRLVTRLSDTVRKAEPSTLKPQDLSNAVWALTKLGIQNAILYNLLADRILLRMDDFKPVNLSMTLWAFARSGIYDEKLLAAASTEVKKQLDDFEPQQVANTAWAMAKCGYVDQELFERTAVHAMSALDTYQPMNFSMLVYAFALAHLPHQELFEEVAKRCTVQALKHSFTARETQRPEQFLLLHLQPSNAKIILKFADVGREAAIMSALKQMNDLWKTLDIRVCGEVVQTVTYEIKALRDGVGYVESELNLDILDSGYRQMLNALKSETALNLLAASTVAYLTSGYALGLRDSHDDNIMLRKDGFLFRVDFGYVFGSSPALDAPATVVPNAVLQALGEARPSWW